MFPINAEFGKILAESVISGGEECPRIQMTLIEPEYYTPTLINAFVQTLEEAGWSDDRILCIQWATKYPTEERHIRELVQLAVENKPNE